LLNGIKGKIYHANLAKGALDEVRKTPGSNNVESAPLSQLASKGNYLS